MLIIYDKPGQLCNRLWAFAPFISYAMNNKVDLHILFFQEYMAQFDNCQSFRNIRFSKHSKLINLILMSFINTLRYTPKGVLTLLRLKFIEAVDFSDGLLIQDPSLKKNIFFI